MRKRYQEWNMAACAMLATVLLAGCSRAPESLSGTAWKLTELKAPDGTQYDEAAYDAIIGATVYRFGENGSMACQVGDAAEDPDTYRYSYENGALRISSDQMTCTGEVENRKIRLQLGAEGYAVLSRQDP